MRSNDKFQPTGAQEGTALLKRHYEERVLPQYSLKEQLYIDQ